MANVRVIPPREKELTVLRVAAYCRVSSDSSDQLHSYAAQIRGYTEEIRKHENWTLVDVYADEGLSGTSLKKQTEFNRMIAAYKRGRIDMKLAFQQGKVSFQYKKLLGYRRGEDGSQEIVPEEAETVRLIYRLYLDGWSLGNIQRELTEKEIPTAEGIQGWSRQVIQDILTNGCGKIPLNQQSLDTSGVALI